MEEQKINVCRTLAGLFGTDPSEEQTAFVGRCALDLGLDESALKLVLQSIGAEIDIDATMKTVEDPFLRRFLFRRLVAAVLLDEDLSDEEKAVIDKVIECYGWDSATAHQYVDHMKAFIEMEKKGEELIARLG